MPDSWLSYVVVTVVAVVFVAIVVKAVINKKKGKSSCSCGGNCGACTLCHHSNVNTNND